MSILNYLGIYISLIFIFLIITYPKKDQFYSSANLFVKLFVKLFDFSMFLSVIFFLLVPYLTCQPSYNFILYLINDHWSWRNFGVLTVILFSLIIFLEFILNLFGKSLGELT